MISKKTKPASIEEYIKAAKYLEKKRLKNEENEQTTENTKVIITNKASIKYILNE